MDATSILQNAAPVIFRFITGLFFAYFYATFFASMAMVFLSQGLEKIPSLPALIFLTALFCFPILLPASASIALIIAWSASKGWARYGVYLIFVLSSGLLASWLFQTEGYFDWSHEASGTRHHSPVEMTSMPTLICLVTAAMTVISTCLTVRWISPYFGFKASPPP